MVTAISHAEQTAKPALTVPHSIYNAPEGQDARILAQRTLDAAKHKQVLVHVAVDDVRLSALHDLLTFFAADVEVLNFPAWDCLPYDRISPNAEIIAQRMEALTTLLTWQKDGLYKPRIVLTTINAITQKILPPEILENASLTVKKGGRIELKKLVTFLTSNGYVRSDTVREQGEFALRGGIIDIFPAGYEEGIRIDLFGDDVEDIRNFDPSTQRTTTKRSEFKLVPVTEYFLHEEDIAAFRKNYREIFGSDTVNDVLYQAVSEGRRYNGAEHFLPLFFNRMAILTDYIKAPQITFDHQAMQAYAERQAQIEDFYVARKNLDTALNANKKKQKDVSLTGGAYRPLPPHLLYLMQNDVAEKLLLADSAAIYPFQGEGQGNDKLAARRGRDFADIRATNAPQLFSEVARVIAHYNAEGKKVLLACYTEGAKERVKAMLSPSLTSKAKVEFVILALEHGFIAPDIAVLTEQDILGDRIARAKRKKKKADNFLREVTSLSAGDYVVHIDHGVGKFEGLETITVAGASHDCLKLSYAGGDKLFVPVENIEVLSRFGGDDAVVELDKLGGAGWQARKARVKKNLMEMAEGLLKIAAARALKTADRVETDPQAYTDFVNKFPYHETEDQLRAIDESLEDMASGKPMDRLVCGDVGFGKTEVALRAAYVAAKAGYQVAIIAPTTLLVRQHYKNFCERFAGTNIRIEQLSRMVNAKDMAAAKEAVANGSARIAIGTHALLGSKIKFQNLGLVVVDEEQRFGVKQKERLKELKENVHVLTLTATPIPRTLQLSLTGVRDMSIIATPPVDRLAIRTFVMPYDPLVIREAIMREHYRGGQTFYVVPRIKDLEPIKEQLKELVPEIKVVEAHGQLTPTELEDRMMAFYERRYDVLLATNIIESGLDIPTANTMIVHRADLFGLSQLYQIRGRVGRSKIRAYAYITYAPEIKLSETAQKRLEVFETLDSLGAGFQLASHDLDIRGAGNLLGDAQSGHIREVGIELYQQMLEDAVAEAKAGYGREASQSHEKWSPVINLGISVLIPEKYVEDLGVRMSLYKRLTELETAMEIESFAAELIDRFGAMPQETQNLLQVVRIKQYCRAAHIAQIDAGPKGAIISFHNNNPANAEALFKWLAKNPGTVKLRPDQKLSVLRAWDGAQARMAGVEKLAAELANL